MHGLRNTVRRSKLTDVQGCAATVALLGMVLQLVLAVECHGAIVDVALEARRSMLLHVAPHLFVATKGLGAAFGAANAGCVGGRGRSWSIQTCWRRTVLKC